MKKNKPNQQNQSLREQSGVLIISRCLNCKQGFLWEDLDKVPDSKREHESFRCPECRTYHLQFYACSRDKLDIAMKGGKYIMVTKEKAAKTKAEKPKKEKKEGDKKAKYGDDIKQKAVALGKQGKTVSEIVKTLNGPKPKAIMRYLKAANVEIKR